MGGWSEGWPSSILSKINSCDICVCDRACDEVTVAWGELFLSIVSCSSKTLLTLNSCNDKCGVAGGDGIVNGWALWMLFRWVSTSCWVMLPS